MIRLKFVTFMSLLSIAAFADGGLYLGFGAGYGSINNNTVDGFNFVDGTSNKSGGNMAGGIYAGYDFNRYVGMQFDYNYIANVSYNTGSNSSTGVQGSINANQQILDLGIIGHLPFGLFANSLSGLSLFGKLAVGYTVENFNGGNLVSSGSSPVTAQLPSQASSIVPVIGGGVEYGWSNVGLRAEYDYIGNTVVTNNSQSLMNSNNNLVLLSVFYHF